jgi:5'-nucleotidase
MRPIATLSALLFAVFAFADKPITITILHTNDLHAHIAPVTIAKKSYGGYARQATLIKRFRATDPNVLLLSGGDSFQGTLYFNVYEGLADAAILNTMGYDAACIGNHEFDHGPSALANFIKSVNFPILTANLDFSKEPALAGVVQPSTVLTVGGEKVGIVGAITPDVFTISSPGPNISSKDLTTSVQAAVDGLTKQGINKILLVTHVGYEEEQTLASHLHDVDAIIGGHSHTPLGTPSLPGWPTSRGPYPTVVKDLTGQPVYVVQAWEWGKVFGRFKLSFDADGHVTKVSDAAPVVVDSSIPEDPIVKSEVTAFERPLLALQNQPVGSTVGALGKNEEMAQVIADAMLEASQKQGAVAAFVNSGGVRSALDAGKITYGQAISVQPFNNTLVLLTLSGSELKAALEEGFKTGDHAGGLLLPSKGTSYELDRSGSDGSRISKVIIAGEPLDQSKSYIVALGNFTANGGDAHDVLKNATGKRVETGQVDIDILIDYIKRHSPLDVKPEHRIAER